MGIGAITPFCLSITDKRADDARYTKRGTSLAANIAPSY